MNNGFVNVLCNYGSIMINSNYLHLVLIATHVNGSYESTKHPFGIIEEVRRLSLYLYLSLSLSLSLPHPLSLSLIPSVLPCLPASVI